MCNYSSKERHQVLTCVCLIDRKGTEKRNEMKEMRDYRLNLYFPKQTNNPILPEIPNLEPVERMKRGGRMGSQ